MKNIKEIKPIVYFSEERKRIIIGAGGMDDYELSIQSALNLRDSIDEVLEVISSRKLIKDNNMTINELVRDAHHAAWVKGWWEKPKSSLECHMLIVSEISEATEEARNQYPHMYFETETGTISPYHLLYAMNLKEDEELLKPEGELIELADAVIRIADYCGSKGWNLENAIKLKMKYNETRSHRHGGKKY